MKKIISLLLAVLMISACFAVTASAEAENYALNATYTAVSTVGDNIYGLSNGRGNDADHTKLNDGYTGYDECTGIDNAYFKDGLGTDEDKVVVQTENTSVCYTGTGAEITLTWDLGEVKDDISKISFLNCRSDFEWADDVQDEDYLDGIWDAFSRSFPTNNIKLAAAGEDGNYAAVDEEAWDIEVVGLDNPYTNAVESDRKDCKQRNVSMKFKNALSARYLQIVLSPARYVLSLDELQIFGGAAETSESATQSESAAESKTSESASQSASESASQTSAESATQSASGSASASESKTSESATQTASATAAPTATKANETPKTGDGSIVFFAALAVIALAGAVVFKKVRN